MTEEHFIFGFKDFYFWHQIPPDRGIALPLNQGCNIDVSFNEIFNLFFHSNPHYQPLEKAILCEKTAIIEAFWDSL